MRSRQSGRTRRLLGVAFFGLAFEAPAQAAVSPPVLKWAYGGCISGPYCQTGWYASPAVADLDGDGRPEVLWGGYDLFALNGADGSVKWTGPNGNRIWPGIAVADLTGDGTLEVIVGRGGDQVTVYNRFGTPVWTRNPFGSGEVRTLAVEDLETDGQLEIVVGRASGGATKQLNVFEPNGSVRPGWPARRDGEPGYGWGMYNENVAVADMNGDGLKEIFGPTDTHYITALDRNGNQLTVNPIYTGRTYWSEVGVHVDNAVDIIGYAQCGIQHRPNFANSAPAIADVNGDGVPEMIVVGNVYNCGTSPYTDLYYMPFILNLDRTRWSGSGFDWTVIPAPGPGSAPLSEDYNVIENVAPNPVIADLDGDGFKEILFPSYDGKLHAYWLDKTEHGNWPYVVPTTGASGDEFRFASEPVVADLDNDGQAEVIFTSWPKKGSNRVGRLHILDSQGNSLFMTDLPAPALGETWNGALGAPTLANIDSDPDLELVIGTVASGAVAYDLPNTANARILWGTGRGGYRRTGALTTPAMSIGNATVGEGNAGSVNAVFTVSLSAATGDVVRVGYATANGTATAGSDYTATSGTLTFAPGTTTRTISVPVLGDTLDEPDETFFVNLSSPVSATIADGQGLGTILDDDPQPTVSVGDVTQAEGNAGLSTASFGVTLSAASGRTITLAYATADGTATAGSDYLSASGTLTFAPGTTAKTVGVPVFGDRVFEPNETFFVNLSSPVNVTVLDGQGLGTITNDDGAGFTIDDVVVAEGRTGPVDATFTVTLSPASGSPTSVDYTTADGSATSGSGDYNPSSGTLSFPPGTASMPVTVQVNPDTLVEGAESFTLVLQNPQGGPGIAFSPGNATILDPQGGADFNGDGKTDIVFRHAVSGKNVVWYMDGVTRTSGVFTNPDVLPDTNWNIVGTNDFNADGKVDLLFRHAVSGKNVVWYMNGINRIAGVFTNPDSLSDTNWKMVGTGDFDNNGKPDILWRHGVSGKNVVWYMDGITRTGGIFTVPDSLADTNWQMVGVGDFSSDGKPDILFRHGVSGKNVVWSMDGVFRTAGLFTNPSQLPDTNWQMVAVGDFDGNEKPDILFRHAVSGKNVVWYMDGITRTGGVFTNPGQLPDTNWKIVGPK